MTMFPEASTTSNLYPQNLNRYYGGGGHLNQGFFGTSILNYHRGEAAGYDNYCSTLVNTSIPREYQMMAEEDESRTETESTTRVSIEHDAEPSSKELVKDRPRDVEDDEQGGGGWLQLSIGNRATARTSDIRDDQDGRLVMQRRGDDQDQQQFVELDLLPNSSSSGGGGNKTTSNSQDAVNIIRSADYSTQQQQQYYNYSPVLPPRPTNLFLQHYYPQLPSSNFLIAPPYDTSQDYSNWGFRPSTSSSSNLTPPSYYSRLPFQIHGGTGVVVDAPRLDFRVVDPPRRPHSGIWFTLQASQNQATEPYLPQIPKSYLRIKDRRMTVRLIIKYLVNKLKLDTESEIEIRCRGQKVLPYLTLQDVRDSIWNTNISPTPDHHLHNLMVLHYGRTT